MKSEAELRNEIELLESNIRASTDANDVFSWSKKLAELMKELRDLK